MEPVGRRRQQQILDDILRRVVSDGQWVVHVRGDPGIGKSTVLTDLRRRAVPNGWTVVETGLTHAETGLSWAGLAVLLRQVPADVVDSAPTVQLGALRAALGQADGPADPMAVAGALSHCIDRMAAAAPVLVLVDDVHWLDHATAGAFSYAIRDTRAARVAFVCASREVELPIDLRRVGDPQRFVDLPMDGLSVAALKALLEQRCDVRLSRVDLIGLHGTTGGNPLHAIEAGRLLSSGRPVRQALLPPSLRSVVTEHLALLPPDAIPVLQAAALSARPEIDTLSALVARADVEVALVAGERAGVVQVDGGAIRFCHPTFAAALVDSLGPMERRGLERRLADVVTDEEERALHRAAATIGTDEEAADAMEAAAHAAERRGAHHLAVERSSRALELTPPDDLSLNDRRLDLADHLDNAGDDHRALESYRTVLASNPSDQQRWRAARGVTVATCHAVGETAAVATLPSLDAAAGSDVDRRADALRLRLRIFLHVDIAEAERAAAAWSLLVASEGCTPRRRTEAEISLDVVRALGGAPVDALELRRLALDTWPDDPAAAIGAVAEVLVWTDCLDAAVPDLEALVVVAEREGRTLLLLNGLDQLADALARLGRWEEAAQRLEQFHELSVAAFDGMSVPPREADLAYLDALRGRFVAPPGETAHRMMSAVERAHVLCRRGQIRLLQGQAGTAVADLERGDDLLRSVGLVDAGALIFRCDLVQSLVDVGRIDDAEVACHRLDEVAATSGRRRPEAESARARAIVLAARGDLAGAAAACDVAIVGYVEIGARYEQARTLLLAGAVARRSGRRSDARAALTAARAVFDDLGAEPFVRRTDEELARVGGGASGGITPTERQVARLVVAGKSNAEIASTLFVSVRTVESNLTKLYRKVGVRSRTELVAHLAAASID
jgi:DNA-binding CsgD family transcriptional regulator/tetratricopeptide (TPR) repeat protein